ncbi:MAG: hypothetical protein A3I38_02170 [Candidatus Wildermuthbacteria bacterium RIFCSPLOWO2_02_FULL_47_10]|uniref:HTH cro/C1-type domain-containing protein n=1 Tax=Candidatus Wildermuthbacteria bacterium RIFCSPHIGHO2_02_FULL_47_17 TaxID=1802452 RepID=A0A1G2R898_9BACT|nr:MAG: hypothetical protein A3D59_02035 [Candidatus Wildermuthbacteria bacterium RIFCSPHIGHO2_02_FULL_47_17]OHA75670.1 MAG: hypothetical protein A3I38_02170 [Candidatus Wildermuthbacteria bacterium RIFCSPLOWO2_02_FULL_47_10]
MSKMKFINSKILTRKLLADPEVKRLYDEMEAEYQIISRRLEKKMSQKQLADRVGTKQSAISRLESGNSNPSVNFLSKVAKALGGELQIRIV